MKPAESFIEQPVRSLQTMLRVIAKDDPSLPTTIPDGIYSPSTMIAVTAFQRRAGLPITGIVDEATWNQLVAAYEPAQIRAGKAEPIEILLEPGQVIVVGERSPYVYLLQAILGQLSNDFPQILLPEMTGILDVATSNALKEFQLLSELPVTGTLDRVTWLHLSRQFTLSATREATSRKIENIL